MKRLMATALTTILMAVSALYAQNTFTVGAGYTLSADGIGCGIGSDYKNYYGNAGSYESGAYINATTDTKYAEADITFSYTPNQINLIGSANVGYDFNNNNVTVRPSVEAYGYVFKDTATYEFESEYLEVLAQVKLEADVNNWLTLGATAGFGWVAIDTIESHGRIGYITTDMRNSTSAKVIASATFFNTVTVYGGMRSSQNPVVSNSAMPLGFSPYAVQNLIGVEAHYDVTKHIRVNGSFDYFCRHPEISQDSGLGRGPELELMNTQNYSLKIGVSYVF